MTPLRVRAIALLAPIAVAGLALLAWTQAWVTATLDDGRSVMAAGDAAAPALPALAIAALAIVAALALAGPVFRVVLGLLQSLIAAAILTSAALAVGDPVGAAAAAVTAVSGVEGAESVRALVTGSSLSAWPAAALGAGILGLLAGAFIAATARRWPARVRRYDSVRTRPADPPRTGADEIEAEPVADRLDAWDALSDGYDPTAR